MKLFASLLFIVFCSSVIAQNLYEDLSDTNKKPQMIYGFYKEKNKDIGIRFEGAVLVQNWSKDTILKDTLEIKIPSDTSKKKLYENFKKRIGENELQWKYVYTHDSICIETKGDSLHLFNLVENTFPYFNTIEYELINSHKNIYEVRINMKFFPPHQWISFSKFKTIETKQFDRCKGKKSIYYDVDKNIYIPFYAGYYTELQLVYNCFRERKNSNLSIEKALNREGYKVPLNSIMDDEDKAALLDFQKRHDLPQGTLNMETIRALKLVDCWELFSN